MIGCKKKIEAFGKSPAGLSVMYPLESVSEDDLENHSPEIEDVKVGK